MELAQSVGPFTLFLLMMVVGLELTVDDFRRVARAPRAVLGGSVAQLVLLPLMTWGVVRAVGVSPIFGAGAVLVAAAPGAGISNILTALAGANTALSVTLTAVASVISVISLPAIAALGMRLFLGDVSAVDVPVVALTLQLFLAMLLPIGIGMWIRARWPEFTVRNARRFQRLAMLAIAVIIAGAVALSDEAQRPNLAGAERALVAAALWTLAAMATGWGVARALRLAPADRFTFLIEFSARNIGVAAIVAISGLARLDLTFFSGVYMMVGYPLAGVAVALRRRRLAAASPA